MRRRIPLIVAATGVVLLVAAAFLLGVTVGWEQGREDLADALARQPDEGVFLIYSSSSRGYVVSGVVAVLGFVALGIAATARQPRRS